MRGGVAAALLLLAAAACSLPAAAAAAGGRWPAAPSWPWTPPVPGSEDVRGEWEKTLALLWAKSKDSVGFCLGRSQCVSALDAASLLPTLCDCGSTFCRPCLRLVVRFCTAI